jgi:two-component system, cell cycle response regulator
MTEREQTARGRIILAPLVLAAAGTIAYALWALDDYGFASDPLMGWVYDLSIGMAAVACLCRAALIRELRAAWLCFGVGLLCWAAGDVYWVQELSMLKNIPYPSWADAGYLLCIPFFFAGVGLLIKQRIGRFTIDRWLDGTIAALAAASIATAFLAPALIGLTAGDPATVLTNLAYPIGDVIVLSFILAALVLSGVRGAGAILWVGAGLVVWCGADIYYLYATGTGSYTGGLVDVPWPLGATLLAVGAHPAFIATSHASGVYRSSLIPPAISSVAVTAILVWDHFDRLPDAAIWLAAATIMVAVARLALSFRENGRLVRELHGEVITDALTGLGNRRKLIEDLEQAMLPKPGSGSNLFALFDLDGFKAYNDNFGHPAGDALLERLGASLVREVQDVGTAYRLGGDEFCVLADASAGDASVIDTVEGARDALSEKGQGFVIGASGGWLIVPSDARTAPEALRLADQRMYEEKNQRSTRSMQQTHDLLMRILHERDPSVKEHSDEVTQMAVEVGRRAGLETEDLDKLARAAQLHDIGKIAIPNDILQKRGGLDEIEWKLMRRHTLIGERILGASTAMKPISKLVRSSHERWDGDGYPDGIAGEKIPLGARIIFMCDSFDAMTEERSYSAAMSIDAALAEIRRCAGTQFDPNLIEHLSEVVAAAEQPVAVA